MCALPLLASCHPSSPVESSPPPPTASPVPATVGCELPKGTGNGLNCPKQPPGNFDEAVNAAIDRVIAKHPEYFDLKNKRSGNPKILNPTAYLKAVPKELEAARLCAIFDGAEIAVKNNNEWSEQYHIWWSSGYVRRPPSAYRATCWPAWF